jgi:SAM-dependent methyltransferase
VDGGDGGGYLLSAMRCCDCEGIGTQFGPEAAARDLRRLRRRGPIRSTRFLIQDLQRSEMDGASLLDIGGGVGAIHHALLDAGAATAVHVDLSVDYIAAARDEATRRGHGDRLHFVHGDFVALAPELGVADVVTLDRVICCYPDMETLVERAAAKARRLFGAVFPVDSWWMRATVGAVNALQRVRRSAFRVYVHSPAAIDAVLRRNGFERRTRRRTVLWEVATYARPRS